MSTPFQGATSDDEMMPVADCSVALVQNSPPPATRGRSPQPRATPESHTCQPSHRKAFKSEQTTLSLRTHNSF